jgi:putrescine transport system substrate-binding protein
LQPLDKAKIPNLTGLDPALMKRVATSDPGNKYAAIYLWGTIGLGVIPSKLKALAPNVKLDSWDIFFKPELAKQFAPCGITMLDSATDVIPSVLRYLHHSPDSIDAKDLAEVDKILMGIRPYIRSFAAGGALEALAAGDTCLVFDYSGDVIQASARAAEAKKDPVVYLAPKEFTQLWFDTMAIPKDAPHPDLAMQFINFMLQPDVIAGVTNVVRYPNAVPASKDKVLPSIRDDHNVYPTAEELARSFTVSAVNQAATRARTRMWARFKAGT